MVNKYLIYFLIFNIFFLVYICLKKNGHVYKIHASNWARVLIGRVYFAHASNWTRVLNTRVQLGCLYS
jgi:lipoprotein-anchoring transpeptidase ErfK/SrfK